MRQSHRLSHTQSLLDFYKLLEGAGAEVSIVTVVLVVWMEADSGVVSWRVVKLAVVAICLTPSSAQVDVDMVLRRVSVVEVDLLVWARTGFERAKYILKDSRSVANLSGSKQSWYSVITAQSAAYFKTLSSRQLGGSGALKLSK
ncbi:hypothetical protein COCVIDRAFT_21313 [Bipolaris victoriae FI3]|uniref:Uncharacterized protein n=1 Tax=Bipolaris victoriae (strain FI3) TaxID=930091 RepID=W7E3P7_BIPV3|nr:hypothetical protein COCVIDRAFT_21313 [Bipolaris victoriae FI3]